MRWLLTVVDHHALTSLLVCSDRTTGGRHRDAAQDVAGGVRLVARTAPQSRAVESHVDALEESKSHRRRASASSLVDAHPMGPRCCTRVRASSLALLVCALLTVETATTHRVQRGMVAQPLADRGAPRPEACQLSLRPPRQRQSV